MPRTLRPFVLFLFLILALAALPAGVGAAPAALFEQAGPADVRLSCFSNTGGTCEVADDFTVPAGATWDIARLEVDSHGQEGIAQGPVTVTFYADAGGFPGAPLASAGGQTFARLTPEGRFARYRLELATPVRLGPGAYWLGLAAADSVTWSVADGSDHLVFRTDQGAWENVVYPGDGVFGLYGAAAADATPPVIAPTVTGPLGDNGWYTGDVTVRWAVTDDESTISSTSGCGTTTIGADTAGTTLTCTATSEGGTASQAVTIRRDATAPALDPAVSPHPVALNGTAVATPNATDTLSGVAAASCGPVDTASVGSKTVACTATDRAGNSASATAGYAVGYQVCALYDRAKAHKLGSTVPIKLQLCDANGANVSGADVTVTALQVTRVDAAAPTALAPTDAGNANPEGNFRYGPTLGGTGGYIYNLSTKGLAAGTWRVTFAVDGVADPAYAVTFGVR